MPIGSPLGEHYRLMKGAAPIYSLGGEIFLGVECWVISDELWLRCLGNAWIK